MDDKDAIVDERTTADKAKQRRRRIIVVVAALGLVGIGLAGASICAVGASLKNREEACLSSTIHARSSGSIFALRKTALPSLRNISKHRKNMQPRPSKMLSRSTSCNERLSKKRAIKLELCGISS